MSRAQGDWSTGARCPVAERAACPTGLPLLQPIPADERQVDLEYSRGALHRQVHGRVGRLQQPVLRGNVGLRQDQPVHAEAKGEGTVWGD